MKKLVISAFSLTALASMSALISYDSFSDAPAAVGTVGSIPSTWVNTNTFPSANNHSYIAAGSLSYAGLKASTGNSWGLGQKTDDYYRNVSGVTGLQAGDHVYYSFLLRLNSPLDAFSTGSFRLYNTAAPFGSGLCVGWGTADPTFATMGFSLSNRDRNWSSAVGATNQKTAQTYASADVTYLVVLGYNRAATYQDSTVELWINPSSSSFGTATPPTATISMSSYQNQIGYNNEAIWNQIDWISSGSASGPADWQVDEFRVATDWTNVVPAAIPEPATIGMIWPGALITLLIRRIRRIRR